MRRDSVFRPISSALALLGCTLLAVVPLAASSHREAPGILSMPQVDGTDFYMFRSYEPGRAGYVTLIANYNPLQDPYGGPNYFPLDPDAYYDIHITNDGDAEEDLTFRFRFRQNSPFVALDVGDAGSTQSVPVPLINVGPIAAGNAAFANLYRSYTVRVLRGNVEAPQSVEFATNPATGRGAFGMPLDNIGSKSFPDYESYANRFILDIQIPGCGMGRVFAGQRKESFAVNLGETFDLVNLNPLGEPDAEVSSTADKNITSLALEVPIDCLTGDSSVIGGWTTARLPRTRNLTNTPTFDQPADHFGDLVQVSRLANPLVNEVAIGLPDKNLFNASHPRDDAQFLPYVTNPTLPELLEILFGVEAPNQFPREDLVQVFLTGVPGLNQDGSVGEFMRLNTAIDPTAAAAQQPLGVLANDLAGYPNGRRPGDDTVDISLRAVMGVLLPPDVAPAGLLPFTDGAEQNAAQFDDAFPYLTTPLPGAPN